MRYPLTTIVLALVVAAAGEIISAANNSELITLPTPSDEGLDDAQADCPHLQGGLLDWSDATAWQGGAVPSASGEDATLAANVKVLLSSTPTSAGSATLPLGRLTIPASSELIIGENANDGGVELHLGGAEVAGALRAGAASCRLQARVRLVLHGTRPVGALLTSMQADSSEDRAYKGVHVQGSGTLELHGKRFYRTWSRLARSVEVGDTTLLLQDEVDWEAGQTLVLVTTALKDARDWHRNEVIEIDSVVAVQDSEWADVSGVGAVVQLSAAAAYPHEANSAYQGEVGLLSRYVSVEGAEDDSEPTDTSPLACTDSQATLGSYSVPCADSYLTGFGAHVVAVGSEATLNVAGVEFLRVGQTNFLGRYPVHLHLMGSAGGARSSMRDCSVHESYYRCISIHGTSNATVSQNVAFDITGYCYYLEDGVEEFNLIEHNLAAHVHFMGTPARAGGQYIGDVDQSDDLRLPADVTASGFYITNAHNYLVGNAASGGWAGFAFPELPTPVKLHRGVVKTPSARPLLAFDGNTAHSSGFWWQNAGTIYFGGKLWHPDEASDALRYNPGRQNPARDTCTCEPVECGWCSTCGCKEVDKAFVSLTNTKVFLSLGTGLSNWGARVELLGLESHDVGLGASILGLGYIASMLVRCRTGATLEVPCDGSCDETYRQQQLAWDMDGNGFEVRRGEARTTHTIKLA